MEGRGERGAGRGGERERAHLCLWKLFQLVPHSCRKHHSRAIRQLELLVTHMRAPAAEKVRLTHESHDTMLYTVPAVPVASLPTA